MQVNAIEIICNIFRYISGQSVPLKFCSHAEAIRLYTEALAGDPTDAELLANRSIAHMSAGHRQEALQDALAAAKLRPEWSKAQYR